MTGPERAFLYRVALATGVRKSELASLTSESFTFDDSPAPRVTIAAPSSKNRKNNIVFLRPDMVQPLRQRIRRLQPGELLFPRLAQRKTAKMIKADLAAAEIPYKDKLGRFADFHALRHSFISRIWKTSKATTPVIMAISRHADVTSLMRYTHPDTSAQIRVIQAMKPPERTSE